MLPSGLRRRSPSVREDGIAEGWWRKTRLWLDYGLKGILMRIHQLRVDNFRGISSLDWRPTPGINCLIGPGDTTKTAVLDAISVLLAGRWNLQFGDADFYNGDPTNEILIEATLCDLPQAVFDHTVFGERLRGVDTGGEVVDDPIEGSEPAITIRLHVDASLEPEWSVGKDADDEPVRIRSTQREHLAVQRLDDSALDNLRWSRTSSLSHLTGPSPDLPLILANAQRSARSAIFENPDDELLEAARKANEAASALGAVELAEPRPGLDPAVHLRAGSLVLHDGVLPTSSLGMGTRRLLNLAIQRAALEGAGILVADEVELGLEPHRLRALLGRLREISASGRQIIFTTHSPIALENLVVDSLRVVQSMAGVTTVMEVPGVLSDAGDTWQRIARSAPSALLAAKIVVGEGSTEVGFCWGVIEGLDERSSSPSALRGVTVMNGGGGPEAPLRARALSELGFEVAVMLDDDGGSDQADVDAAAGAGCLLLQWDPGLTLEGQLCWDLPVAGLQALVDLAIDLNQSEDPEQSVRSSVESKLEGAALPDGLDVATWLDRLDAEPVRVALGVAAQTAKWFKSETKGHRLGRLALDHRAGLDECRLKSVLESLSAFTHPPET